MEVLKEMPPRNPINGTFELTVRCNLKCKMCLFRHDDSENAEIMAKEKTAEEWIDMARQVAEAGTLHILITGGEPMLRPDFCEIYEEIYKMGFIITLYTNATLITPKIMNTLRRLPPHKIGVTLYGASENAYKKVCGSGEAYYRAIEGLDNLRQLHSILELRATIIKENVSELDEIEKMIKLRFGDDYVVSMPTIVTSSVRGGSADVKSCRMPAKDYVDLLFSRRYKLAQSIADKAGIKLGEISYRVNEISNKSINEKGISLYGCNAGINSYTITWDGKLIGCQMLDDVFTNPFLDKFNTSWNNFPDKVKVNKLNKKCINCKLSNVCNACPAIRISETGSASGLPEYCCEYGEQLKKYL